MKKRCLAVLLCAALMLFFLAPAGVCRAEEELFDLAFTDAKGNEVNVSDFRGQPVVINFWATWCPYCLAEMPFFNLMAEEYAGRAQFMMVDLADGYRETVEKAADYIEAFGYTFPVFYDLNGASDAFTYMGIPVTLLMDSEGRLSQGFIGMADEATLRELLEGLLGE